jgi:hypothetical protein
MDVLMARMRQLLHEPELAAELGRGARETALARFNIRRFAGDWESLFGKMKAEGTRGRLRRRAGSQRPAAGRPS